MKQSDRDTQVRIRSAVRSDIPRLISMIEAIAAFHGDIANISAEIIERDIFSEPPWIFALIAEVGEDIVGYAALSPLTQFHFGSRGMELHHLFVDERQRGRGIGKCLINASKQKAQDLSCNYLNVGTVPENKGAQAVYLASGFELAHGRSVRFRIALN